MHPFLETLSHFKNYLGANIATKAIGFISIPVLTRLLTPQDYGIINVFLSYVAIFTVLLTLNTHSAVGRYFYEERSDFNNFFGTTVILSVLFLVISFFFLLLFKKQLSVHLNLPTEILIYLFPVTIFGVVDSLFQQVYQPLRQSKKIAGVNIAKVYFGFGLTVALILFLVENRYLGFIWSSVIVGFLSTLYLLSQLRPFFTFAFQKSHIIYIGKFSIPLIPYALSGIILAQFDRIMINRYIDASSAGLYSFAYNVGMLLSIFIGSLNAAWVPTYYNYMNRGQYEALDREINYIVRLMLLVAISLIFFGKEIGMILASKNFHAALKVIPIVVMGYVFFGIFTVYGRNIGYAKKTIFNSAVLLTAGVANILLNAMFIPRYGYIACAYTTLASYFIMALLAWIVSKYLLKLYSTPLQIIAIPLISVIPFITGFYFIENLEITFFYKIIQKALLLSLTGLILFYKWIFILASDFLKK